MKETKKNQSENLELLAPAGDMESLKVAIGNGANSVYFGANYFNARKKAKNISDEEMEEAIDYAHLHSCRAYLTLNTLLLDEELDMAAELAGMAGRYGIDAVIVQDLGFAAMLKNNYPDLPIHASTQATIYDEYAIDACACIGFSRIILPRELSIPEIKRLTQYAKTKGIETEVFAHGALCVSYSGQCVMSSLIGGRSGNRGECAQPCRLPYDLTVLKRPKNQPTPHLATKDISAFDHIEELIKAGVASIKIEGRMRSPEYVGEVIREFRTQIQYVINKMKFDRFEPAMKEMRKGSVENLLLAFNRGGNFSDHYLTGHKGPDMMAGSHVGSFGVLLGEIAAKNSKIGVVDIRKTTDVEAVSFPNKGDVISIRRTGSKDEIASAPIGSAVVNGTSLRIKGFHPAIIDTLQIGDRVYRMSHSLLAKEVLAANQSKTPLEGILRSKNGTVSLEWTVTDGISKGITCSEELDLSQLITEDGKPGVFPEIQEQRCIDQLSKTGGTPFIVEKITVETLPAIPVSSLNHLRRESLAGISEKITGAYKRTLEYPENEPQNALPEQTVQSIETLANPGSSTIKKSAEFQDYSAVEELIRNIDILSPEKTGEEPNTKNSISVYYYSWDGTAESAVCGADWYELPVWSFFNDSAIPEIQKIKELEPEAGIAVVLPPAYIGSYRNAILELIPKLADAGIDAIVSGNPGNSWLCRNYDLAVYQDSGSNVMNSSTAALLQEFGADLIVPSVELSLESLLSLTRKSFVGTDCILELPAYGKLRLMYSEHCPVGYNRSGCKACESGAAFALKDRKGISFPVICHKGPCTAEILNGDNLCAPSEIAEIATICPVRARLYFTDEVSQERINLVKEFRNVLGNAGSPEADRGAERVHKLAVGIASDRNNGLTKGHYQRGIH